MRGGAATVFYPLWRLDVESLLVLKNNKGTEETRIRNLDYGVQFNKLMYQRLVKGGDITLFDPSEVDGLLDAFYADQEEFERLYVEAESRTDIRKKTIPAIELFSIFMQERAGTGRIYIQNIDNCNTHSPFKPDVAPVKQSNLCVEVALPTEPLQDINDVEGEIALCTLAAFNLSKLVDLDELEELSEIVVRMLNALLDYQDYPVKAAYHSTMNRRPLGVGAINYANYLARNGVRYSDGSANELTHTTFEAIQYYLLKASNKLAQEEGACPKFNETTYSEGILPIDTASDKSYKTDLVYDWETLREDIVKYGLRNSTLTALMPSETSSQVSNATNGIEPPRGLVSTKASKDGILKQVVPDASDPKIVGNYELLWDIPNNDGYIDLVTIMQRFVDQTISANFNYDPSKFPGNKVPMKLLLGDMVKFYQKGGKTVYYHNTRDGAGEEVEVDDGCAGGACKI